MNAASWPDDDPQIHPADISLPPTQPIIIVIPKDSAATPPRVQAPWRIQAPPGDRAGS